MRICLFFITFVLDGADGSGSFADALCSERLFNSHSFSLKRAAFTVSGVVRISSRRSLGIILRFRRMPLFYAPALESRPLLPAALPVAVIRLLRRLPPTSSLSSVVRPPRNLTRLLGIRFCSSSGAGAEFWLALLIR